MVSLVSLNYQDVTPVYGLLWIVWLGRIDLQE